MLDTLRVSEASTLREPTCHPVLWNAACFSPPQGFGLVKQHLLWADDVFGVGPLPSPLCAVVKTVMTHAKCETEHLVPFLEFARSFAQLGHHSSKLNPHDRLRRLRWKRVLSLSLQEVHPVQPERLSVSVARVKVEILLCWGCHSTHLDLDLHLPLFRQWSLFLSEIQVLGRPLAIFDEDTAHLVESGRCAREMSNRADGLELQLRSHCLSTAAQNLTSESGSR
jgi:hypothetical protein